MKNEIKNCQNCKQDFEITSDDFSFYEKIKVPPPTFCPECQFIRRMVFRNQNTLYKRKNNFPGKEGENIISMYSEDKDLVVYDRESWWSDEWDPFSYGVGVDFNRPFLDQLKELFYRVPMPSLVNLNAINSEYCHNAFNNKDCYLVFGGDFNENCSYSTFNFHSRDSQDLYLVENCNLCYESTDIQECYKVLYGQYSKSCTDCTFIYDCINCNNCVGCVSLRNKSYCIFNEQYSKEEYYIKLQELGLNSRKNIKELSKKFEEFKLKFPRKFANVVQSINCTGDNIAKSKNCINCFDLQQNSEDLKNVLLASGGLKDSRNMSHAGHGSALVYDSFGLAGSSNIIFSMYCKSSVGVAYSLNCNSCENIFGCVGLKSGNYVILNKRYTKEEYEALLPKVIAHMNNMPYVDARGVTYKYGEFWPSDFSPFCYNETVAFDYFPVSEKEALKLGYKWKSSEEKSYIPTMKSESIPESIADIDNNICDEVLECSHKSKCLNHKCTLAFRITSQELVLYKRLNIAIPELCPNCRHYERMNSRNPMKLWHRYCMCEKGNHSHQGKCEVKFETSYAPDRPEIVCCEKCYQQEVY